MDEEIVNTLGELERKLHELERVLSTMDREQEPLREPEAQREAPPQPVEASQRIEGPQGLQPAPATQTAPAAGPDARESRLVDEAIERRDFGARAPAAQPRAPLDRGAEAQPPDAGSRAAGAAVRSHGAVGALGAVGSAPGQPTSATELLRFRDRLERTARELTSDYNELLGRLGEPAAGAPPTGATISFARGAPSLDIIDVQGLRDAAARAFDSDPAGTTAYGTSVGYPRLRAWIADRHGVEVERVLVTNGSMQADAFLFECLVGAGEDVIVERPTYDRTLLSLRQRGARVHAIELEPDGIDTIALARLLAGWHARPKLAHIIPNFQNPAGYTLSLAKRHALLDLAATHSFMIFEDDPYVALRFRGESLPTMLSLDPQRVIYASSFSKTVCPGVRVGYLVGPPDVIAAVAELATSTYISPSMVAQSIVYEFCASGAIERSIETVRRALDERSAALANALRRELPEAEFVPPDGGYFMWVTLPAGTDVHALHHAASELGVSFVVGTDFMLEGGQNALRLAYAGVTPKQINEGVMRLAAAYRSIC